MNIINHVVIAVPSNPVHHMAVLRLSRSGGGSSRWAIHGQDLLDHRVGGLAGLTLNPQSYYIFTPESGDIESDVYRILKGGK